MANVLKKEKQLLCLRMLVEGSSIRSTERVSGVHRDTIMRLAIRFGERCETLLDRELRDINSKHVEIDEQWTFVGKKQGHLTDEEKQNPELGDQYLYLAQDQDSKLIICHRVGKRNEKETRAFIDDLSQRIKTPGNPNLPMDAFPQLSTDGWAPYPGAIWSAFRGQVQYGQIVKNYHNTEQPGRYGPPEVSGTDRRRVQGISDLATICTSHIERFNCTTRQFVKRFTRLTLAFSKRLRNLKAAVAMHLAYYDFCWRPRENEGGGKRLTPAMAAGVTDRLWKFEDLYDTVM